MKYILYLKIFLCRIFRHSAKWSSYSACPRVPETALDQPCRQQRAPAEPALGGDGRTEQDGVEGAEGSGRGGV